MKEEDILRKKYGNANPYRVPQGYFENFSKTLMERLPAQPEATTTQHVPAKSYSRVMRILCTVGGVAAVTCGVLFGVHFFSKGTGMEHLSMAQRTEQTATQEDYVDEALDYAMIDDHEIYAYLSDAN